MTDNNANVVPALRLILDGTLQDMDATTILKGLELLTKLVKSFTDQPVKMGVLEEGSAVTGLLVPPEVEAEVLDGIVHLREGHSLPENWTLRQVQHVRDLTKLDSNTGVTSVSLSPAENEGSILLDQSLARAIDSILTAVPLSLGSVTGVLYSYSANEGQLRARLHPTARAGSVKIGFTDELDEEVRRGLRKKVSIYGLLKRHPVTHVVEEIDARRIRILAKPGPAQPGRGIWRDLQNQGVTVDELMKSIRGEDWVSRENG